MPHTQASGTPTTPTPVLNGQVIGQTERATRAVLEGRLAGTGISFHEWVLVRLVAITAPTITREQLVALQADGLKIDPTAVLAALDNVVQRGLATATDDAVALTQAGNDLYERIFGAVAAITERLYGDLPADDLETTRRVLSIITERANAELAAARGVDPSIRVRKRSSVDVRQRSGTGA
jgi:DNA-binding MarR family transcriptional regulator